MLSVSANSVLQNGWLKDIDYRDPAAVLNALNVHFQMEHHADMYFTVWYGVFERTSRCLRYSSAGHPAAVLLSGHSEGHRELGGKQLMIGADENAEYETTTTVLEPDSRLFLCSDGVFEFTTTDSGEFNHGRFIDWLKQGHQRDTADSIRTDLRKLARGEAEDDFSLVIFDIS